MKLTKTDRCPICESLQLLRSVFQAQIISYCSTVGRWTAHRKKVITWYTRYRLSPKTSQLALRIGNHIQWSFCNWLDVIVIRIIQKKQLSIICSVSGGAFIDTLRHYQGNLSLLFTTKMVNVKRPFIPPAIHDVSYVFLCPYEYI